MVTSMGMGPFPHSHAARVMFANGFAPSDKLIYFFSHGESDEVTLMMMSSSEGWARQFCRIDDGVGQQQQDEVG